MTSTRPLLLFALLLVGYFIYGAWQQDYAAKPAADTPLATTTANTGSDAPRTAAAAADVPSAASASPPPAAVPAVATASPDQSAQTIDVQTDVLHIAISTSGGSLVRADLLAYPVDPKDKTQPVRLLDDSAAHYFVAQTGLISNGAPAPDHKATFGADKTSYALDAGTDKLEVPLTWRDGSGLSVRKVYIFTRGSYLIDTREEIGNAGTTAWTGYEYRQLQRVPPPTAKGGMFAVYNPEAYAFAGAAYYSPQDKFSKLAFAKFAESPLNRESSGAWAGMLQHYFFAAWIPAATETDQYTTSIVTVDGTPRYLIRAVSPALSVAPNQSATIATRLYVGPKLQSDLANIAPGLELTADYGMLTVVAQ